MSNHHRKLDPSDPQNYYCRNCGHHHSTVDVHFCANCGQKNTDGRTSMGDIWHEFLHNTLHLDEKFFKMLRFLFIPGKLTVEFFQGRQKRYPHPTRFFLVIVALFLYLVNSTLHLKAKVDQAPKPLADIREKFHIGQQIRKTFDSLPQNLHTPESAAVVDSLFEKNELGTSKDSTNFGNFGRNYRFASSDFALLTPDSLIEKYKIEGFFAKISIKQAIKVADEPTSIVHSWIGSLTATILLLLTLMSPVLMLLFRKTRPFFVEHFIFLMHHTTTLLLGMSVLILLGKIGVAKKFFDISIGIWWVIWMTAGMVLAMRRFYERKWPEILGKWLIFSLLYAAVGLSAVFGSLLVSFLFLV